MKTAGLVSGSLGTSKSRNAVYFSLVSPLDPNPDPKYKPCLHLKKHHDLLCVIDLEPAQSSLAIFQTVNGSSVRVLDKDHQTQRRIRKVRKSSKEKYEEPSPKKKSRYDQGQSSYHCQAPTLPCLRDSDAASVRWMAMFTTNTRTLGSACTCRRSSPLALMRG